MFVSHFALLPVRESNRSASLVYAHPRPELADKRASARVDLDSGLLIETLAQAECYGSDDKQEGTTAFLEKRKPKFTGR